MDMSRLNPWNWFKEEDTESSNKNLPTHQPRQSSGVSAMEQLYTDIDKVFKKAMRGFGPFGGSFGGTPAAEHAQPDPMLKPKLDIQGTDKEYIITVELPGVEQDGVHVDLRDNALFIRGEKKVEKRDDSKGYYRVERSFGSFQRILSLPEDADPDAIKASCKDGVLTVTVQRVKGKEPEAKSIPVTQG